MTDPAAEAYEALAPFYDAYTAGYDYERWLGNLEPVARELGLEGRRVLDVACGTGKSFVPMLERGYEVTACDISPAMLDCARERAGGGRVDLHVADMRALPLLGTFDLATCLDDALNYLLTDAELEEALAGIARNLRPGGILLFDVNTLATYRDVFASDSEMDCGDALFSWRGTGDRTSPPGALSAAVVEVFSVSDGERCMQAVSHHIQRHHPPSVVTRALGRSGFELLAVYGQITGAQLEQPPDEDRHVKLIYFARISRERPFVEAEGR